MRINKLLDGDIMKKILLLLLSITFCVGLAASPKSGIPASIVKIINHSDKSIFIGKRVLAAFLADVKSQAIPFSSWREHHDAVMHDKPYIPDNAFVITIDSELWGVWQDERGIWCARHYTPGLISPDDCLPIKLFSFTTVHKTQHLAFLLLLNQKAQLSLKQI